MIAVAYFSMSGHTKKIADQLPGDKFRIQLFKKKEFDLNAYDTVYIGGPVWAGNPSRPLKRMMNTLDLKGKTIRFFLSSGGMPKKSEEILKKMAKDKGAKVAKFVIFYDKDAPEETEKKIKELTS